MMGFMLKIFFVGLIAFVPNENQREMTVLLLDAREGYAASDGQWLEPHQPLLLARSKSCVGQCDQQMPAVAQFLFDSDVGEGPLYSALQGGGAWQLENSQLLIRSASVSEDRGEPALDILRTSSGATILPTRNVTHEDFDWVQEMAHLDPGAAQVDPDVLREIPQKGLIAARLKLSAGTIRTHRLLTVDDLIVPVSFETLRDQIRAGESRAMADWLVAEVPISGCEAELVERNFITGAERVMRLAPPSCSGEEVVEVALLNMPRGDYQPNAEPQVRAERLQGPHFEMYYELSNQRPPNHLRPVPVYQRRERHERIGLPVDPPIHPSELLSALGLTRPRGVHSQAMCIMTQFAPHPEA